MDATTRMTKLCVNYSTVYGVTGRIDKVFSSPSGATKKIKVLKKEVVVVERRGVDMNCIRTRMRLKTT